MVAAIYARKSTDQAGVAHEQKSVARHVEHARAYATWKGWRIDEAYIYVDDGISGAEFTNRPGFLRLMNALKPQATAPGTRDVGGIAPRPSSDRDGVCAEATRHSERPRVLLSRGSASGRSTRRPTRSCSR